MKRPSWLIIVALSAATSLTAVWAQASPPQLYQVSDGSLWVVADGMKHRITPQAVADERLAGVPEGAAWADGLINPPAAAAAPPAGVPANFGAEIIYSDVRSLLSSNDLYSQFATRVTNGTGTTIEGARLRWDALDGSGVIVGSKSAAMPRIGPGVTFIHVAGMGVTAQPSTLSLAIENAGKPSEKPGAQLQVDSVEWGQQPNSSRDPSYRVSFNLTNGPETASSYDLSYAIVLRDSGGAVVGVREQGYVTGTPDSLPPGSRMKQTQEYIKAKGTPAAVEVYAWYER